MAESQTVRVVGRDVQVFEPIGLGSLDHRYRKVLRRLVGKRQSEIIDILDEEIGGLDRDALDLPMQVLRVALHVLRDYVVMGQYPLVRGDKCFLADVAASAGLTDAQQRTLLSARYRALRAEALSDRGQVAWLEAAASNLATSGYAPHRPLAAMTDAPPHVRIVSARNGDLARDARALWRSVRATWSMGVEASAPGREVSIVALDERWPGVPLGVLQFRNVVPEIRARDEWMGTSVGTFDRRTGVGIGYLAHLSAAGATEVAERAAATQGVLRSLLEHVRRDGLRSLVEDGNVAALGDVVRTQRVLFDETRAKGAKGMDNAHLRIVKRAQTAQDLLRGLRVLEAISATPDMVVDLAVRDRQDLDAGLTKLWHYHMGFVAIEMSICGAAPPFGPVRVGKLMAALSGSAEAVGLWGTDRPLGMISAVVYDEDVREAVPNPGPLVIFTSGLFPGHSAQYNRVSSGTNRWRKIGDTLGFGSSHVSFQTSEAMRRLNAAVDGYTHISRTFGEGSGARFRSVGRALSYAGLPDLLRHETRRPLYALPLVDDPQGVLFGWSDARSRHLPGASDVVDQWWKRWFAPHGKRLVSEARAAEGLDTHLFRLIKDVRKVEDRKARYQVASAREDNATVLI